MRVESGALHCGAADAANTCARWGRKRLVLLVLSCALASRALDTAECLDDGQCVDAREPGECADCAACARVCSPPAAAACLTDCGFAVLDGAYDGPTLGALHTGFQRWFDDGVADGDARRHLSFSHRGGLRGRRVHVALPDGTGAWRLSPPMIDAALYNVDVVRAAQLTLDHLGVCQDRTQCTRHAVPSTFSRRMNC